MKPTLLVGVIATLGGLAWRRQRARREEEDLWREAAAAPDLR